LARVSNRESLNEKSKLRRRITRGKEREARKVDVLVAKKERKIISMAKKRDYYYANKERLLKNAKERHAKNPHLARSRASEIRHKRRVGFSKILTKRQKKEVLDLRMGSKILEMLFGEKYSLDHIIPINNKSVCGLHAPWNMQILTHKENNRKLNRFDGTYDNESWRLYV
jgi:5-methylcytosine-specific restriction endonuclease McrA